MSNQDLLFQEKVLAYKDLIFHVNYIFESFYDLMEEMLDHEGSNVKWEKFLNKESEYYNSLVADLYKSIFKVQSFIDKSFLKKCRSAAAAPLHRMIIDKN